MQPIVLNFGQVSSLQHCPELLTPYKRTQITRTESSAGAMAFRPLLGPYTQHEMSTSSMFVLHVAGSTLQPERIHQSLAVITVLHGNTFVHEFTKGLPH